MPMYYVIHTFIMYSLVWKVNKVEANGKKSDKLISALMLITHMTATDCTRQWRNLSRRSTRHLFFVVHLVFCCVPSNRQNLKWICWTICIWAAVSVARILYKITSNSKSCPFFSQFKLFILKWLAYDSIIHWMEFNRNQQKFIHPTDLKWQREWKKKVLCVVYERIVVMSIFTVFCC